VVSVCQTADSVQRFYEYSLNNNVAKGSDFLR
jgi:hypothetical protein